MLSLIIIAALIIFILGYRFYGRFLEKRYEVNDSCPTPSHSEYDGVDRVPAKKPVLLGHHFSSIAGAGPIVGPIIAAAAFGWVPALFWVVLGSLFVGGVHDFSALIASIRHKARSIAQMAKEYMTPRSYKLFLLFILLTLVYVLIVFMDLTAATFVNDGGVATSASMFMVWAVLFGILVYRLNVSVLTGSLIFVPLVFLSAWGGEYFPMNVSQLPIIGTVNPLQFWSVILLIYCLIASVTPVWILLQPRDYLSSYLLYASVISGFFGILLGGFAAEYPAFKTWNAPQIGALFPILFITVACGACSGFHSVVASGTTSKQLDKESDAKTIGYGAMLIEGFVAVMSIICVAIIPLNDSLINQPPLIIYGTAIGKFLSTFGIPAKIGYSFGLLALSTFILTTLDTVTRLGRYIFEEFFDLKGSDKRFFSTLAVLALPLLFTFIQLHDKTGAPIPVWKAIWPVFGATNQLLAGLSLLVIFVWLRKTNKRAGFVLLPMLFMIIMTTWALVLLLFEYGFSAIGVIAFILLILAILLIIEAAKIVISTASDNSLINRLTLRTVKTKGS